MAVRSFLSTVFAALLLQATALDSVRGVHFRRGLVSNAVKRLRSGAQLLVGSRGLRVGNPIGIRALQRLEGIFERFSQRLDCLKLLLN